MIIARTQHHVMSTRDFLLQSQVPDKSNPFNDNSFIMLHRSLQLNIIKLTELNVNRNIYFNICLQECQVEDSGTESDDETDKEEGDDIESEEGDMSKLKHPESSHSLCWINYQINEPLLFT